VNRFVLDASVALRWFLDNPVPVYASRVREAMRGGARARVPALWHLEMANGLIVAERRGVLAVAEVESSLLEIEKMLAKFIDSDASATRTREILAHARSFRLTAYDAAYLELAFREGLPLATLDSPLRAAAQRTGIATLL
jgi:predicted nucleic acid-binding protein